MLEEIESDNNNRDAVKASSLYYQAVIYAMKKDPNKILATERLKTLQKIPDEFQCLFQESEWRDQMMEKYLLEEGQKVEDYVQKFKKKKNPRRRRLAENSIFKDSFRESLSFDQLPTAQRNERITSGNLYCYPLIR